MAKVLLVEDEESIRKLIAYDLSKANYQVVQCEDGKQALQKGLQEAFDIMILDWMLPYVSGIELVSKFREKGISSVIIMLTAKDDEEDILNAFEAGVDDYVTKPFSPRQLLARIQAHIKRLSSNSSSCYQIDDVNLNLLTREVTLKNKKIDLTKKEFELLEYLMRNQNVVLTRDNILNEIWDFDYDGDTRIVDVHIFKLRSKLQGSGVNIRSLRGVGYCLEGMHENH